MIEAIERELTVTIGSIVGYVLPDGPSKGQVRPGIVVRIWSPDDPYNGSLQLQVFTDSDADGRYNDALPPLMWKTSVKYSEDKMPGTWHWPEPLGIGERE